MTKQIKYSTLTLRTESFMIERMTTARGKPTAEAAVIGAQAIGAYELWRNLTDEVRAQKDEKSMKRLMDELMRRVEQAQKIVVKKRRSSRVS